MPLSRHHPAVTWVENGKFKIARLSSGKLSVKASETKSKDIILADCPGAACSYLSLKYSRKIGLPDLKAAENSRLPVPILAEAQTAVICWNKDQRRILQAATFNTAAVSSFTFEYCAVRVDGIKSGSVKGLPELVEGYAGPLIQVETLNACVNLLRRVFKLNVVKADLENSFLKEIRTTKMQPANRPAEPAGKNTKEDKHE